MNVKDIYGLVEVKLIDALVDLADKAINYVSKFSHFRTNASKVTFLEYPTLKVKVEYISDFAEIQWLNVPCQFDKHAQIMLLNPAFVAQLSKQFNLSTTELENKGQGHGRFD